MAQQQPRGGQIKARGRARLTSALGRLVTVSTEGGCSPFLLPGAAEGVASAEPSMRGRGGDKEGLSDTGEEAAERRAIAGCWERKWRSESGVVVSSEARTARFVQPPCSRPR